MDLLRIAVRIEHLHPIDGLRALMQKNIKADDNLAKAVKRKRYNTFVSLDSIAKLQRIANVEFKLSTYKRNEGTAAQQLTALRSSGFKGLQNAEFELQYVKSLATLTRGKHARAHLQWMIDDLRKGTANATNYWESQLAQAKSEGKCTEMELAATWLGGTTLRNVLAELGVSAETPQTMHTSGPPNIDSEFTPSEASQSTITEAFTAAAETHGCLPSELKRLEGFVVSKLALPARSVPAGAPYAAGDFPPLSRAALGTNLLLAQTELSNVAKALAANPGNPASAQLRPLVEDLHARVGKTMMHWLAEHKRLDGDADAMPSAADEAEIERIALYLGMTSVDADLDNLSDAAPEESYVSEESRPGTGVTSPFSHMSATESFAKAMEMGPLSDEHIHQLVSNFVNRHLLPNDPAQGSSYKFEDLPDPYKRQSSKGLVAARDDLHDTLNMIKACQDEVAKSRLMPALSDLQARVDAADTTWRQLYAGYEKLYAKEATHHQAEWLARARIYIGSGTSAPSPYGAAFTKLMAQPSVSKEDVATVRNLFTQSTGIPAGEIRRLEDFTHPDVNVLFRSFPELKDEAFELGQALHNLQDEANQKRLTELLNSLDETIVDAEAFMLEENQRLAEGTRGISENWDAIALTWKWLARPEEAETPASRIGDIAPGNSSVRNTGEVTDVIEAFDEVRHRTSQASHLFDQAAAEQTQENRQASATSGLSRGYALMTALR